MGNLCHGDMMGIENRRSRNFWIKENAWKCEFFYKIYWLVVWTPLKNISQLGWLFPIYGKIKNVPNHQPVYEKDQEKREMRIQRNGEETFWTNVCCWFTVLGDLLHTRIVHETQLRAERGTAFQWQRWFWTRKCVLSTSWCGLKGKTCATRSLKCPHVYRFQYILIASIPIVGLGCWTIFTRIMDHHWFWRLLKMSRITQAW